ncbi:MAG: hypothetical protein K9L57_12185 [Spirochaetaceae bacterium]|nr:hypothetical protein [Spirochaetaceae bacterium]
MIRKTLELARVGVHGLKGQSVSEQDLKEMVETFSETPVTIGHRLADWMPAFGKVVSVSYDGKSRSLAGVVELSDLLAEAMDQGLYSKWSIGAPRRAADGKRVLHHLAFLGAVPPAVKNLKIFDTVNLSDVDPADEIVNSEQEEEDMTLEELQAKYKAEQEARQKAEQRADAAEAKLTTAGEGGAGSVELSDVQKENEALRKRIAAGRKQALIDAAKGKVPKDKEGDLVALADRLSADTETIELSDSEGKKEEVDTVDLLSRILAAIPTPVKEGEMDLSDEEDEQKTSAFDGLAQYV